MQVFCALLLATTVSDVQWHGDYREAVELAKSQRKVVFIQIGQSQQLSWLARVPAEVLDGYVMLRLPLDYSLEVDGEHIRLLDHQAFAHLMKKPGFAMIDFRNEGPHYGRVVSVLPAEQLTNLTRLLALFELPVGNLTQRTLIWALRVHPEHPESAEGESDARLMKHAADHSSKQARMNLQHHNLPSFATSEIVAESWPWNRDVVSAALDIVDAWSQSPGHWREASRPHRFFGYDMHTIGRKWFATGVFID